MNPQTPNNPRQGGYDFTHFGLFVCLLVGRQVYTKTNEWISKKNLDRVGILAQIRGI